MNKISNKPVKVAITGNAGAGKSVICNRLKIKHSVDVIFSDKIAREVVSKNSCAYNDLLKHFGKKILLEDMSLNRALLRKMMLLNKNDKDIIEKIIQNKIVEKITKKLNETKEKIIIAEVPLLFELNLQKLFDIILLVTSSYENKIQRITKRDKISVDDAKALLNIQKKHSPTQNLNQYDFVIENNRSEKELIKKIDHFYNNVVKNFKI